MNKTFITKMVQAKKLEIEAFQELLPDEINERMKNWRVGAGDWLKECAVEIYLAGKRETGPASYAEEDEGSRRSKTEKGDSSGETASTGKSQQTKRTKKVTIE